MTLVAGPVKAPGGLARLGAGAAAGLCDQQRRRQPAGHLPLQDQEHSPWEGIKIQVAEKAFEAQGRKFNAGSIVIKPSGNRPPISTASSPVWATKAGRSTPSPSRAAPDVPVHDLVVPRVAVMHTWQSTQAEGWVRIALDDCRIPYDYISVLDVRDTAKLRDKYDVILFGPSGDAMSVLNGVSGDKPIAWKKTPLTPNLGTNDDADDIRGGLDLEGRPPPPGFRPGRRPVHDHHQQLGAPAPVRPGSGPLHPPDARISGPAAASSRSTFPKRRARSSTAMTTRSASTSASRPSSGWAEGSAARGGRSARRRGRFQPPVGPGLGDRSRHPAGPSARHRRRVR